MASPEKSPEHVETLDGYGYRKDFRTALPQFIAVSVKNLLLLGYGMTLGFPTILIPAVKDPREDEILHLGKSEISWLSSINYIIVPVGCALSGALTAALGRRKAMQVVNLPFLAAWLIFHFATETWHLYAALFFIGLSGGLLEAPVLTYVAEITQPHLRGALSATSSLCIILGVFTQFLFGIFLYWRTIALINISFTVLAVVTLCFVPESPHWLISRQRDNEARKSLQWLRGWKMSEAVDMELKDIQALFKHKYVTNESKDEKLPKSTLTQSMSKYLDKTFLHPFLLISYSFFVVNFSGMTTLQTYAVSIFQMLEAPIDKYYATLVLGILQMCGACLCVLLVHYTGKRPLTLVSTAGAGVCCVLIAAYEGYIRTNVEHPVTSSENATSSEATSFENPYSWIPTSLLMMLAFITHIGVRLLPWILIGEIFNAKTRAAGAGFAGGVGYMLAFLANKLYISMVETMSILGTYGFYGIVCLTGCVVFYYYLPETEGKKLNDIENHFAGIKRLDNNVYRSKKKTTSETSKTKEPKGNINQAFEEESSKL